MTRNLLYGGWLLAVWLALWGEVTVANVASGVALVVALLVLFPTRPDERSAIIRPVPTVRFAAYFLWKLVEASAVVAWEVATPRNKIREGVVAIPIRGVSDGVTTLVANAISLTPGTLTIEVATEPTVLYVHVLHLRSVESVRREVLQLEALALRAFGPAAAVDAVTADLAVAGWSRPSQASVAATESRPEEQS